MDLAGRRCRFLRKHRATQSRVRETNNGSFFSWVPFVDFMRTVAPLKSFNQHYLVNSLTGIAVAKVFDSSLAQKNPLG
jgi:hypothetical protein